MFSSLILSVFIASQSIEAPKPVSYHDRLLVLCEGRAGDACCRASARAMQKEQARLFDEKIGCPTGTVQTSLACPASYSWCTRDIDGKKGRLQDLSEGKKPQD